jgi:glycosyltransferase involved in cell wall biosynthesis
VNEIEQKNWVGFVSNSAWYIYIHRYDVICFFIDKGYHILIVAPEDRHVAAFEHPSIKYINYNYSNKTQNPFAAIKLYSQLKKIYQVYRPICVFHYAIKANIFGSFAAQSQGVKCVAVINGIGYAFTNRNLLFNVVKKLYQQALKIPQEVWFLNNEDGSFFIQHKMVPIKKVHILHGEGINTQHFLPDAYDVPTQKPFTFIIATRLLYSKGIGTLADAARVLKNQGKEFNCILVGVADPGHPDSVADHDLQKWQTEGLLRVIPFTEDVRPLLANADCFVLPSYYNEGLPRCLMEAASMRMPIITTYQKGCKEAIVNNVSGLFCKTKDPVDLADKMLTMMEMPPEKLKKMGKNGRLLMQTKFSIDRICKEYLRVVNLVQSK